ncbi:nucleotidyltransferase family protein [Paenibacillus sp. GCM10027628]|uniref:nucleotidyltransferase family protein n=1 Tax=Paenibacillus sp. GCM10027628 TaxID=3273413 RepID=UPI00362B0A09
MEAIILAGGQGTRLRPIISDIPKPMAPIGDKPFLNLVMDYLCEQGIHRVILSTGYKHEVIEAYYRSEYRGMSITYSVEEEPLGTGGGILKASQYVKSNDVVIINGDTLFQANLKDMYAIHTEFQSDVTMALKIMNNFDRYGAVKTLGQRVIGFEEKKYVESGFINGGVYLVRLSTLRNLILPERFSFEKDFLERYIHELSMHAYVSDANFIDIGIPEDYRLAQEVL